MNLVEEILREHTKKQKDKIVRYVGHNPKRFSELVDIFLQGPYLVTQRAAWPLSYCIEQYPDLLKPHFRKILTRLGKKNIHDSVKRNILRMLQFVRVPKAWQGITCRPLSHLSGGCQRTCSHPGFCHDRAGQHHHRSAGTEERTDPLN